MLNKFENSGIDTNVCVLGRGVLGGLKIMSHIFSM